MLCKEGKLSILAFMLGIILNIFAVTYFGRSLIEFIPIDFLSDSIFKVFFLFLLLLVIIIRVIFTRSEDFQVSKLNFFFDK